MIWHDDNKYVHMKQVATLALEWPGIFFFFFWLGSANLYFVSPAMFCCLLLFRFIGFAINFRYPRASRPHMDINISVSADEMIQLTSTIDHTIHDTRYIFVTSSHLIKFRCLMDFGCRSINFFFFFVVKFEFSAMGNVNRIRIHYSLMWLPLIIPILENEFERRWQKSIINLRNIRELM